MRKKLEKLKLACGRFRRTRMPRRVRKLKIISRHPYAVPLITLAVLVSLTGAIYGIAKQTKHLPVTPDAKIVIISHDHQQQIVPSRKQTVGSLLQKLNLKLDEGDVVEPAATTMIDQDQFRINIYRAVPVEVVDGSHRTFAFSAAKTPRAVAQQAGTTLYPEDIVNNDPVENFLQTGAVGGQIVIDRATPVAVDLYGTPVTLRTHAKTIAGLMKEKNIKLAKDDKIEPAPDTPITPDQHVAFIRTGVKVETVTEQIATPVQTINDPTLAYGTSAVRQQGSAGQQVVTYQIQLVNNVETGRTVIQKIVNKQPVTQIVVMGTSLSGIKGDMALAGIAPGDYQYADYIISRESGWCPTKWQGEPGSCPAYHGTPGAGLGYGLGQATPGSKMAAYGADWATNPITQLKWASGYATRTYGSWASAYDHWVSRHNW
ncbi:MAG: G5 domain-containing protein [Candidatus Saccharimonadales bacterium]